MNKKRRKMSVKLIVSLGLGLAIVAVLGVYLWKKMNPVAVPCPSGSIPNCPTQACKYLGITSCWMNTRGVGPAESTLTTPIDGRNPGYYGSWSVTGADDAVFLAKTQMNCKSFYYTPVGPNPDGGKGTPCVWLFTKVFKDMDPTSDVWRYAPDGSDKYPNIESGSFTGVVIRQ
jgi:hypothetical protein